MSSENSLSDTIKTKQQADFFKEQLKRLTMQSTENIVGVDSFDELLELLNVPHTKGSTWYDDAKIKVSKWQATQPQRIHTIDEDELDRLAKKHSEGMDASFWDNGVSEEVVKEWAENDFKAGYKSANSKAFSLDEVLEIIRFVIYSGTPEFYEQGGVNGVINFPKGETYAKAKRIYEQYLKQLSK